MILYDEKHLANLNGQGKVNANESKKLTGYASIDKPWLKWYQHGEDFKDIEFNKTNCYDYFFDVTKNYDWPLIEYYGKKYTKEEIKEEVDNYIKRFTTMGIKEGDTVSFILLNVPETMFFLLALSKMGAAVNLIKFDESPERIKFMTNLSNSKYLFASEVPFIMDNVSSALDLGSNIEKVISLPVTEAIPKEKMTNMLYKQAKSNLPNETDEDKIIEEVIKIYHKTINDRTSLIENLKSHGDFITFDEWKNTYHGEEMRTIEGGADNTVAIVYTGGTTGAPKGVELTNNNLNYSAHNFLYSEMDFYPKLKSMDILPPSIGYYFNATYDLLCCGVSVNFISQFKVQEYPNLIKEHKPNIFMAGPILLKAIVDADILDDTSFMVAPISGGDKLFLEEEERFNEYAKSKGGIATVGDEKIETRVRQGWGLTESTAAASYLNRGAAKTGSIGIPLIDVTVGVFDYVPADEFDKDTLEEKKYGEIGELCITGDTVMKGYLNNPEATKALLREHSDGKIWLHSDDLGYIDEDGRIYHKGRAKRMLTRSGAKVWLGTLEDTIRSHPMVDACCCVKMEDVEEREVPVAHIVLKDTDSDDLVFEEIDALVKTNYPECYLPKFYVKKDELPITEVNKKIDFKSLEKENILDPDNYSISGKVITPKVKLMKK